MDGQRSRAAHKGINDSGRAQLAGTAERPFPG